ncbi:hypothetical protein JM83_3314 [Gillisia sp. Hel_I_86]|uniref:hypothetical protein n=1 Tax=Gillisia sp. Hel_I_86 TaxID=1249981 RepID=UPI0011998ECB|nr:hypothetical protein [Gillisia sp. Hel_I_86]TVZ28205.1 hypothetical protein JM83_3314 [Gillisia sp. Hel_I_86]
MKRLKLINFFWGIVLFFLLLLSVVFAYISTDAPYYLSMARDIALGYIPYRDIFSSYTPIAMYLNSLVRLLTDNPSYHLFLTFQYCIIAISVLFFYKISRSEGLGKALSAFLSLFLFIAVLSSDGSYINLEVYVIMFCFMAYYLLIKKKFFWCGFFLALGFFSKQYGIFNFLPFFVLIFVYHGYQKDYFVKFILGMFLPLIIFLTYFVLVQQVSFTALSLQLTGSGYDQEMIELEATWFRFLAGAKIFILLVIPIIFVRINPFRNKIDTVLILGIFVNLLPLYIQTVAHYFILSFPFVFILLARNLDLSNKKFFMISNLVLAIIAGLLFARINRYKGVYNEQLEIAEETRRDYPVGSDVFLYKHFRFLYILNDYRNPVLEEIGYRYGFKPDGEFREKYEVLSLED